MSLSFSTGPYCSALAGIDFKKSKAKKSAGTDNTNRMLAARPKPRAFRLGRLEFENR
jgi:hypothetical protein